MSAYAVLGKLYLDPTNAGGTSGTLINGIQERLFRLEADETLIVARASLGTDPQMRTFRHRSGAAKLILEAKNQEDVETLKLIFAQLTTTGGNIRPEGGTATNQFAKLPSFAAIVRPDVSTEEHIYSPGWTLSDDTIQIFTNNDILKNLDEAELTLVAGKPTNITGPSYLRGTIAEINAAYGF